MSVTKLEIVAKCKRCGKNVIIKGVETSRPDPEGKLLLELTRSAARNAMCPRCRKALAYYSSLGKGKEFMEGKVL